MRQHIREAKRVAKRYGGEAEFTPGNPHGKMLLTDKDGRTETIVVSWSPRCIDTATKIVTKQVAKFMEGKAHCAIQAQKTGEDV